MSPTSVSREEDPATRPKLMERVEVASYYDSPSVESDPDQRVPSEDAEDFATQLDVETVRCSIWTRLYSFVEQSLIHTLSITVTGCTIASIVVLSNLSTTSFTTSPICSANGQFSVGFLPENQFTETQSNLFTDDAIFSINLSWIKDIDFSTARLIDVMWDIIVGRGVQGLLGIVSYTVFNRTLSHLMETRPVYQSTFEAVTLQNGTFFAIFKLIKQLIKDGGLRLRLAMVWMVLSALYVLISPSLISAMTGYTTAFSGFVRDINDQLVEASSFANVVYVIHDGSRLGSGFHDEYPVVDSFANLPDDSILSIPNMDAIFWEGDQDDVPVYGDEYLSCLSDRPFYLAGNDTISLFHDASSACILLWYVSQYVYTYGIYGGNGSVLLSSFNDSGNIISITGPPLNISAYASFQGDVPVSKISSFLSNHTNWYDFPVGLEAVSRPHLAHNTTIYSLEEFNAHGACIPQQDIEGVIRYTWGSSFVLLLSCMVLQLLWTLGMYTLYMTARLNTRLNTDGVDRHIGLWRAVMDLAAEYNKTVTRAEAVMGSEKELSKRVGNGTMSYQALIDGKVVKTSLERRNMHWRVWSRFRREVTVLSFVCFVLLLTLCIVLGVLIPKAS